MGQHVGSMGLFKLHFEGQEARAPALLNHVPFVLLVLWIFCSFFFFSFPPRVPIVFFFGCLGPHRSNNILAS